MPKALKEKAEKQIAEQSLKKKAMTSSESVLKANKYNNKPTDRNSPDGAVIRFDSKKEADYYSRLLIFQKAGKVRNIRLQVQYLLEPSFKDGLTGEKYQSVCYYADFVFERLEDDGEWKEHIVDTKGKRTDKYIIKRKMMRAHGYYIEEV